MIQEVQQVVAEATTKRKAEATEAGKKKLIAREEEKKRMKNTSLGSACELEGEEEATGDDKPGLADLVLAWPDSSTSSPASAASFALAPPSSALGLKSLATGSWIQGADALGGSGGGVECRSGEVCGHRVLDQ